MTAETAPPPFAKALFVGEKADLTALRDFIRAQSWSGDYETMSLHKYRFVEPIISRAFFHFKRLSVKSPMARAANTKEKRQGHHGAEIEGAVRV